MNDGLHQKHLQIFVLVTLAAGCGERFNDACPDGTVEQGTDCVRVVHDAGGAAGAAGSGGSLAAGSPNGGAAGHVGGGPASAGAPATGGGAGMAGHAGGGAGTSPSGGHAGVGGGAGNAGSAGAAGHGGGAGAAGQGGTAAAGQGGSAGEAGQSGAAGTVGSGGSGGTGGGSGQYCQPSDTDGCSDATTVLVCNSAGNGFEPLPCGGSTPFCSAGKCVSCVESSQCSAPVGECLVAACKAGQCGSDFAPSGTVVATQTPGDCVDVVCDSNGGTTTAANDADVPADDGNPCTNEVCTAGVPSHPAAAAGTACGSGGVCNGAANGQALCGVCVPGATRCASNSSLQTCGDDGQWKTAVACADGTPACSAGACVGVTGLSAGGAHTCAVLSDGTVRCWGADVAGQLGDGMYGSGVVSTVPVSVTMSDGTPLGGVVEVAGGGLFTCARKSDGTVWCWGWDPYGEIGDGGSGQTPGIVQHPVQASITGVSRIAAGGEHACALLTDASIHCWGQNAYGEVGVDPSMSVVPLPTQVAGITGATAIACGFTHSCAIVTGGTVKCWGQDVYGQLGDGNSGSGQKSATPVSVASISGAVQLSLGNDHSAVTLANAAPECWGNNGDGECAPAMPGPSFFAVPIAMSGMGTSNVQVALGGRFSCAIDAQGTVRCVGRNDAGQVGDGSTSTHEQYALPLSGQAGAAAAITAGGGHACALLMSGVVQCWGADDMGQTGDGKQQPANPSAVNVVW